MGQVRFGEFLLSFAACLNQREMVELFWNNGAELDAQDSDGDSALHGAFDGHTRLAVVASVRAGEAAPSRAIRPGEAAYITTGAPLPPGADAVVALEQATILDPSAQDAPRAADEPAGGASTDEWWTSDELILQLASTPAEIDRLRAGPPDSDSDLECEEVSLTPDQLRAMRG